MSLEDEVGEQAIDVASAGRPGAAARVRWHRRRPPADDDRFSRVVWWCGHIQLFIAAGAVPTGLILIGAAIVAELSLSQGPLLVGATALGLSGPIALSGLMLRSAASDIASLGSFWRWIGLLASVLAIAAVATIAALVAMYFTVWGVLIASSVLSGLVV